MSKDLDQLREIETRLLLDLSKNPVFIKLQSIRNSISVFENGFSGNGHQPEFEEESSTAIPITYSFELSWREKTLFAIAKLKKAFVSEIITELKKLGETQGDEFLKKRVSITASNLKKNKVLGSKAIGKKAKYFIR